MNVLVVGSGGREHALAWKIARSPRVERVYCAPGNAGTAADAENVAIAASDIPALLAFAKSHDIGLTVVGPDDVLAAGIVDVFEEAGLKIFGPRASAARLESSKAFAKDFMHRHGIPTASYREFTDSSEAQEWCRGARYPLVIKADGLALGKGVVIASSPWDAALAIYRAMDAGVFGDSGRRIVIEEYLVGVECSIHAFVDGTGYLMLPDCRDHKRALDGDRGPNTGGMGTISPSGTLDEAMRKRVHVEILDRFLAGVQADGLDFRGMLFPGLMLTADGPKVLEFNCRWGDPETQVLVHRIADDIVPYLEACCTRSLSGHTGRWSDNAAACVILASRGYPASSEKGCVISGVEIADARPQTKVFHAGTALKDGHLVTAGGRVLGVSSSGDSLKDARRRAYEAADCISFSGLQRRNDIGATTEAV